MKVSLKFIHFEMVCFSFTLDVSEGEKLTRSMNFEVAYVSLATMAGSNDTRPHLSFFFRLDPWRSRRLGSCARCCRLLFVCTQFDTLKRKREKERARNGRRSALEQRFLVSLHPSFSACPFSSVIRSFMNSRSLFQVQTKTQ